PLVEIERARIGQEVDELVNERLCRIVRPLLPEAFDELGRRGHSDVGCDQGLFELLPGLLSAAAQPRHRRRDRPPAAPQRSPELGQESAALALVLRSRLDLAEQLPPGATHATADASSRGSRRDTTCETPSAPIVTP